ncbi:MULTISPECIES: hypothetical protein [Nocardia]|uniref:hypothetical protein n=1 Tax=Nocardia TaxID=1817 RepID=UPI00130052FA|nr:MULTISPECIES: hypothetical protein [Nocardia]
MGLGDFGEFLGHVGTLGVFKVIDNHDRSDNADNDRGRLDNEGKLAWEGDRSIIGNEWTRLDGSSEVSMAKPAVTDPEAFSTWSHEQIWNALNGGNGQPEVRAGDINAGADGWRRLTTGTETAVTNYRNSFERVLSEKWSGTSGTAAIDAVKSYTTEAAALPTSFQMVANGIDYMEGLLGQAKMTIPKPDKPSGFDEFLGHIPGNGLVKAAKHRANEAEADAQRFMIGTYQPGSVTVDNQTPVLPVPRNTVADPGTVPGGNDNGNGTGGNGSGNGVGSSGNNNGGTPTANPTGTQENPATNPQSNGTDGSQGNSDGSTKPSSTDPSGNTPTGTTPAGTDKPTTPGDGKLGGSGSPGTGSPGSGSSGSGSPGSGALGGTGAPGAGRSVTGTPGSSGGSGSGSGGSRTSSTSGTRGMNGMPGMGGRGGGGRDDEDEHKIPDYLIQDRENELIGQLPATLPPGGVIGG